MRRCFGQDFDVPTGYLDTSSMGIPPRSAVRTLQETLDDWAAGRLRAPDFDGDVATARAAFAAIAGVDVGRVTTGASVSQLVATVATNLPAGARVLVCAGEFTSLTFPFAAQSARGIAVTEVPPDRLLSEVDGHDLVAVSLVQSADGARVDLDALQAEAARTGARLLLDVTQAAGWVPLRLDGVDYAVCAGYKWLLCPRGTAWLVTAEPGALTPIHANWYAGDDPWTAVYDLPLRLAGDARRLDLSPVWFAQRGAAAVLPWLATLDAERIAEHNIGLANRLRAGLGLEPARTAVVSVDLGARAERLSAAGIRVSNRAGHTRFACHLYNEPEDVDAALEALDATP